MQHYVIVSFGKDQDYEYRFSSNEVPNASDEAHRWFDREFTALECDVATPTGKVLVIDRILSVAKYAGQSRFRDDGEWAERFARYAAAVLGRDLIRVDVPGYSIGY